MSAPGTFGHPASYGRLPLLGALRTFSAVAAHRDCGNGSLADFLTLAERPGQIEERPQYSQRKIAVEHEQRENPGKRRPKAVRRVGVLARSLRIGKKRAARLAARRPRLVASASASVSS